MFGDRRSFLRLVAAGAAGLAGCASDETTRTTAPATGTATGSDAPAATGTPTATARDAGGVGPEELRWTADLGWGVDLAPAVTDDGVVVGGAGGLVRFDADGRTTWTFDGGAPTHPPTVDPAGTYAPGTDTLWGLGPEGEVQWTHAGAGTGHPHVLGVTGDVVLASRFGHEDDAFTTVEAVGVADGEDAWDARIRGPAGAAVHEGTLYLAEYGAASAYGAAGGAERWHTRDLNVRGDLVGVTDDAVVARGAPSVSVFERSSGERRWRGVPSNSDAALAGGLVLVSTFDAGYVVEAHDLADGTEVWSADAVSGDSRPTIEAIEGDRAYVTVGDRLHAVGTADGELRWFWSAPDAIRGVEVVDGTAFVRTATTLHAVRESDERWSFAPDAEFGPLAAGGAGLCVGAGRDDGGGTLYVFDV